MLKLRDNLIAIASVIIVLIIALTTVAFLNPNDGGHEVYNSPEYDVPASGHEDFMFYDDIRSYVAKYVYAISIRLATNRLLDSVFKIGLCKNVSI